MAEPRNNRWMRLPLVAKVGAAITALIIGSWVLTACAGQSTAIHTDSSSLNVWLYGFRDGFVAIIAGICHWFGADVRVYANAGHYKSYDGGFAIGIIAFWFVLALLGFGFRRRNRRV